MALLSSEQVSRNRSTSTGASELPQHEHKRPRLETAPGTILDSGEGTESVMAEVPSSRIMSPHPPISRSRPATPAATSTSTGTTMTTMSPTSKVTINTRPLSAQSANFDAISEHSREGSDTKTLTSFDGSSTARSESPTIIDAPGAEPAIAVENAKSPPISIPSSPDDKEVTIQIGEPQDMEEPEEDTNWSTISGSRANELSSDLSTPLWQTFPFRNDNTKSETVALVVQIAGLFEQRADAQFVEVFRAVNDWLSSVIPIVSRQTLNDMHEDTELYEHLPRLMSGLLQRGLPVPTTVTDTEIVRFIASFGHLTVCLLRLDTLRLKMLEDASTLAPSVQKLSIEHLRFLIMTISPGSGCFLHINLRNTRRLLEKDFIAAIALNFLQDEPTTPFQALLDFLTACDAATPTNSQDRVYLIQIVQAVRTLLHAVMLNNVPLSAQQRGQLQRITRAFALKANEILEQAVSKQQPWLTLDNSGSCLDSFCRFTSVSVMFYPDLAQDVFAKAEIRQLERGAYEVCDIALEAFKLALLKQLIHHGRMELRVFGIETMANELVGIWTRGQKQLNARRQPMLDLVVNFLRSNDMVRYILSAESHPQIVKRGHNVIGFLCVSSNWQTSDSDVAWQAILSSHDHRNAAAIIENLKLNLQHLDLEALIYLYKKLQEVPFEKFDTRMLSFTMDLLGYTSNKSDRVMNRQQKVNATVDNLCLHLLREAHSPSRCGSEVSDQIREHITGAMTKDQITDLTDSERHDLLTTICNDVACHYEGATGSVIAMTALLNTLDSLSAARLVAAYDYARLLFADMAALATQYGSVASHPEKVLEIEYRARLNCMLCLILKTPDCFEISMYESFWTDVLTSLLPHHIKSRAWSTLAEAYRQTTCPHPFLDFVSARFQSELPATQFDKAVLEFAQERVMFELRYSSTTAAEADECLQVPSMESVWRIMLESNDKSVEETASEIIMRVYLDNAVLVKRSPLSIEKTHAALVDRCIQIVINSARQLNSPQPTENDMQLEYVAGDVSGSHEARLHRALLLLRKFLDGLKTRPRFRPAATEDIGPLLEKFEVRGEPSTMTVRVNSHPQIKNDARTWVVGQDNTCHEVWHFLCHVTGWSQINLIRAGGRLSFEDNESTIKDMKLDPGPVIITKALMAADTGSRRNVRASSPVDSKVMHHFDELYALLESRETIAKAIYDFLTMFASQENVVADIKSMTLSPDALLPVRKPFKLLYFATALRACIEEESFSSTPNAEFLVYAVHTVIATLEHIEVIVSEQKLCMTILQGIVETLQLALRAKVSEDVSNKYITDHRSFAEHVLAAWASVQLQSKSPDGHVLYPHLSRDFFDVIIETTLHDDRTWQFIDSIPSFDTLFTSAILLDENNGSRQSIQAVISRLAGVIPGKGFLKGNDLRSPRGRFTASRIEGCLQHVWSYICPLVAKASERPEACREVLDAAMASFEVISKKLDEQTLILVFVDLKSLLLGQHNPKCYVYCTNEHIPYAIARLMSTCMTALSALGAPVPDTNDLILKIYQQFLFPPLSDASTASLSRQSTPMVEANTRTALYDVTLSACQSAQNLNALLGEIADGAIDRDAFCAHTVNERKALRSDQGYCGVRNLSNTCYLNSLFCQLFMNIKFRELMIGINIVDENKQKLVLELGNVFANMQSSYEKYVNPEDAVDSITQYTGEQIDVSVQMDVDEFFNLLFDRLEAQIVDHGAREVFKSMYGGQLVQQIKSKECEHVSERTEPFSAVQVEIKGKSGLEDGLKAYVEGEVLQGENKYSCTSCGRHVDAVKRACIKEMPDNLIFNMKRFDYDIMTGMRTKINDKFQFPDTIDMTPYTVEALSDADHNIPPDMFELVGVIIHSGTAETGHYYSFVRQRPSARDSKDSWVQFNDTEVSKFDTTEMREQAFGGCDQSFSAMTRFYNGYMLFYQRSSSIEQYAQDYPLFNGSSPAQVTLPPDLDNGIAQENEICLRRYVAQDPAHARFVLRIAERMRAGGNACSDDHELEDKVIDTVLDYIQQVSSRWKELPDFDDTIKILHAYARDCPRCALRIVEWFRMDKNVLDSILRAWYLQARKQFAMLFTSCHELLWPLRHSNQREVIAQLGRDRLHSALYKSLEIIVVDWSQLQRAPRGWDQLFGVISSIAEIGPAERTALVELGFLEKTAEIIWVHHWAISKATLRTIRQKYNMYLAAREKHRPFSHGTAMRLFAQLLPSVQLAEPAISADHKRLMPSDEETKLLQLQEDDAPLEWLKRLTASGANAEAAVTVVRELCEYPTLLNRIGSTLYEALESLRIYQEAARFLEPCGIFVAQSTSKHHSRIMVDRTLKAIADTDGFCSDQYLDYVNRIVSMEGSRSGFTNEQFRALVLARIDYWAPMLLMAATNIHHDIRNETVMLLQQLLFSQVEDMNMDELHANISAMSALRNLVTGIITHARKYFIETQPRTNLPRLAMTSGQASQAIKVLEEAKIYLGTDNAEDEELVRELTITVDELNLLQQTCIDLDDMNWREASSDVVSDVEFNSESSP